MCELPKRYGNNPSRPCRRDERLHQPHALLEERQMMHEREAHRGIAGRRIERIQKRSVIKQLLGKIEVLIGDACIVQHRHIVAGINRADMSRGHTLEQRPLEAQVPARKVEHAGSISAGFDAPKHPLPTWPRARARCRERRPHPAVEIAGELAHELCGGIIHTAILAYMETLIQDIVAALRTGTQPSAAWLARRLRRCMGETGNDGQHVGKLELLAFYRAAREERGALWNSWSITPEEDARILRILTLKPRRSASGVATITVVTMPHACSGSCVFCPNDVRMPKSYLANEPACQRAERNFFDPYLQVRARLRLLQSNGHITDKIELIVLGGTWSDYPQSYQIWFISQLFRALNDSDEVAEQTCVVLQEFYRTCGLSNDPTELAEQVRTMQESVTAGACGYNRAIEQLYAAQAWREARSIQTATLQDLYAQHRINENAACRVVGLCVETRPDLIDDASATFMRRLGCTKVQMGIQSLDQRILDACGRRVSVERIAQAFSCLRRFGFKILVHMMANLPGATPQSDMREYRTLVQDPRFLPDEVKLYPCVLVESSRLSQLYGQGMWQPYPEEELVGVLAADVAVTPAYVRISRMIRDISSGDIVAGNKKTNLRQMVDEHSSETGASVAEIRSREIATGEVDAAELQLACMPYSTAVSDERFLQWITPEGKIAGFLRLSLPHDRATAMIREVHVYGRVAEIGESEDGAAQHQGLGRQLVEEACAQAKAAGYGAIRVISSVGTRAYYRKLGFSDEELYQRRELM